MILVCKTHLRSGNKNLKIRNFAFYRNKRPAGCQEKHGSRDICDTSTRQHGGDRYTRCVRSNCTQLTIVARDLNDKHSSWHSRITTLKGRDLFNFVEQPNMRGAGPDSPGFTRGKRPSSPSALQARLRISFKVSIHCLYLMNLNSKWRT
jgi:hypothetical protein